MSAGRSYFIGVRGKLVLFMLLLVVLSMWLLGLSLMKLTKSGLNAQLQMRGGTIASSVEHVIELLRGQELSGASPKPDRRLLLVSFLDSLVRDGEIEQLTVFGGTGEILARAGMAATPPTEGAVDPATDFSLPLLLGPGEKGSIRIVFSREGLRRPFALALVRIVVQLAITALVIVIFINLLTSVSVLAPIRKLLRATERIASGDLSSSVDPGGSDEFGDLSRSFNTMLQRLRDSEERNRKQLDSLRKAHADLQAKERQLIESEKMAAVGAVAAGVAHEVGNPLASVTGYLAMLDEEGLTDGEREEYLSRANQELSRINRIMLDLLNYARPAQLELADLDLNAIIRDVHLILESQSELEGIGFKLELESQLPPLRGDLHRLQQLLINLILNAAQSMPEGGAVTVKSFLNPSPESGVGMSVTDRGAGITAEDLPRIFEPFFTTRTGGEGSGLGLALCRQIVTAMEATIMVDSSPGVGSTFTVIFPAADTAGEAAEENG